MAWSFAIYEYHEKSKIVKPKQAFLLVQEGKLKVANAELEKSQAELTQIKA
jgi:dynein heavy chain, axonemal